MRERGEAHGIVNFGMRALLCMRLEKNFPTWFSELRPIYGGFEAIVEQGAAATDSYVQGFVIPVPAARREDYRKMAESNTHILIKSLIYASVLYLRCTVKNWSCAF